MHARRLDVLHDAGHPHLVAVAHGVDVDLDRVLQETVEQDLVFGEDREDVLNVLGHLFAVDRDSHSLPAKDVAGPDEDRVADLAGDGHRLIDRFGDPIRRERDFELAHHVGELASILGKIHLFVARPEDSDSFLHEPLPELQRRLPAQLQDHALGLLVVDHVEDALPEDGLEVELVGHVEVGRHRLGIAVQHQRFVAQFASRMHAVDARVVELDALPDPVRP